MFRLSTVTLILGLVLLLFIGADIITRIVGMINAGPPATQGSSDASAGERTYTFHRKAEEIGPKDITSIDEHFHEGALMVSSHDKFGFLNPDLSYQFKPQFDEAHAFSDGMALVKIGDKYGFISHKKIAIAPQFDDARDFSEGLAPVSVDGLWGFIDKGGAQVIKPKFAQVSAFNNGVALVIEGDKTYAIDKTGKQDYELTGDAAPADIEQVTMYPGRIWATWREPEMQTITTATSKVVFASKNIEEGEIIPQEALEERDVDAAKAPIDAFNSINAVIGQQAAYPIPAGTIVSVHAVKPMAVETGFYGKIAEGNRAVTLQVNKNSGINGFMQPGSRVDILAYNDKVKAGAVLSDAEIVAVDGVYTRTPKYISRPGFDWFAPKRADEPAPVDVHSLTFTVSPKDAATLVDASKAADLYFVLRNEKDHGAVPTIDVQTLKTGGKKPARAVTEIKVVDPKVDATKKP